MITGIHTLIYTKDSEAMRAFFRDVLEWPFVDAGRGWLIFGMPPAEIAAHPSEDETRCEMYLMCDDLAATIEQLKRKNVEIVEEPKDQGWGIVTAIRLPDGSTMGLYQPRHPIAPNPR